MQISAIRAIIYKNVIHMSRYKFDLFFWAIMPVMWVTPLIFQGLAFVGGTSSDNFAQLTGSADFLSFLVVGSVLFMFVSSAVWGAGNAIRWEQESGTLEVLWATPASRVDILIGTSISETIWASINVLIQFSIISLFLQIQFQWQGALISIIVLSITIVGLYGFGILMAGVIIVFKEPGTLTEMVEVGMFLITPVRYSLQALPSWVRMISLMIPFTLGLSVIRKLISPEIILYPVIEPIFFVVGLIILDVLLWLTGIILFTRMENHTRKKGSLGAY
ncbi:MAG: ABC transporter permease [Candidatus Hodarchaeales archaeon]|jgi:ABC-2 type transport system permease protein